VQALSAVEAGRIVHWRVVELLRVEVVPHLGVDAEDSVVCYVLHAADVAAVGCTDIDSATETR
jgi:hypothetical protein